MKQLPVPKKYKLEEFMNNLPKREYAKVKRLIPDLIDKSINTFNNYAKIPIDSKEEIPNRIVIILEDYFGMEPRGLSNIKIECKHYKELI